MLSSKFKVTNKKPFSILNQGTLNDVTFTELHTEWLDNISI